MSVLSSLEEYQRLCSSIVCTSIDSLLENHDLYNCLLEAIPTENSTSPPFPPNSWSPPPASSSTSSDVILWRDFLLHGMLLCRTNNLQVVGDYIFTTSSSTHSPSETSEAEAATPNYSDHRSSTETIKAVLLKTYNQYHNDLQEIVDKYYAPLLSLSINSPITFNKEARTCVDLVVTTLSHYLKQCSSTSPTLQIFHDILVMTSNAVISGSGKPRMVTSGEEGGEGGGVWVFRRILNGVMSRLYSSAAVANDSPNYDKNRGEMNSIVKKFLEVGTRHGISYTNCALGILSISFPVYHGFVDDADLDVFSVLKDCLSSFDSSDAGITSKEWGSTNERRGEASEATIIRRRALYLLELISDDLEGVSGRPGRPGRPGHPDRPDRPGHPDRSNSPVCPVNKIPFGNPKLLSSYLNAFNSFSHEFQSHLVDQSYSSIVKLVTSDNQPHETTWEWLSPLVQCGSFSPNLSVRKLSIYRFLSAGSGVSDGITSSVVTSSNKKKTTSAPLLPMTVVPLAFVKTVLVPALNSLGPPPSSTHFEYTSRTNEKVDVDLASTLKSWLSRRIVDKEDVTGLVEFDCKGDNKLHGLPLIFDACSDSPTTVNILKLMNLVSDLKVNGNLLQLSTRNDLLLKFSRFLSSTTVVPPPSPTQVLYILSLYSPPPSPQEIPPHTTFLSKFLANLPNNFSTTAPATLATMFVQSPSSLPPPLLPPEVQGTAIALLASLTEAKGSSLWPTITRNLQGAQTALYAPKDKTKRACILLSAGCECLILGGSGNGELVVSNDNNMLPPPVQIEVVIDSALNILINTLTSINFASADEVRDDKNSASQQNSTLTQFFRAAGFLNTMSSHFPNSRAFSSRMDSLLKSKVTELNETTQIEPNLIGSLAVAVECGAGADWTVTKSTFEKVMESQFSDGSQNARSAFQVLKWSFLQKVAPSLFSGSKEPGLAEFARTVCERVNDEIFTSPSNTINHLFFTSATAATFYSRDSSPPSTTHLLSVFRSMWNCVLEESKAYKKLTMITVYCQVVYSPSNLENFKNSPEDLKEIFNNLIDMSRNGKPYIGRAAASSLLASLSGNENYTEQYKELLFQLVLSKEQKIPLFQQVEDIGADADELVETGSDAAAIKLQLPANAPKTSYNRALALLFLERLENTPENANLTEYLVDNLLKLNFDSSLSKANPMTGTLWYLKKLYSFQTLCLLAHRGFVTEKIAKKVAKQLYEIMAFPTHGPIRYYIECFAVLCTLQHPAVFTSALFATLKLQTCSAQLQSSLLIILGYLLCSDEVDKTVRKFIDSEEVMLSILPWLGSTQGFARACSQLLAFEIIPTVPKSKYLDHIFDFLSINPEMKNLRKKQSKFFANFSIRQVTTAEGLLSVSRDEEDNAIPTTLVDILKNSMVELYNETHSADTEPVWKVQEREKQIKKLLAAQRKMNEIEGDDETEEEGEEVDDNFQRKILPFDLLDLQSNEITKSKNNNAAGNSKQKMIVCASLIDKAPNLGGLARTCEIFALEKLVIPHMNFSKMDNFKAVSVSAGDWVDIEACPEEVSLQAMALMSRQGLHALP